MPTITRKVVPVTLYQTLSVDNIANKKFALDHKPLRSENVRVDVIGGTTQEPEVDYTVTSQDELSWDGLGLDADLEVGDKLRVSYFK